MDQEQTHPSYGMLSFSRINGGSNHLFGSCVSHDVTIRMELKRGSVRREYNQDWYYEREPMFCVEMSQNQFAELITSFNTHGTPVTIRYLDRKEVEKCPFVNQMDLIDKELKKDINDISDKVVKLSEKAASYLNQKEVLKKAERNELLGIINNLVQEIKSNLPFLKHQVTESIEKTITVAKMEIEAQAQHTIHKYGIESLKQLQALQQVEDKK